MPDRPGATGRRLIRLAVADDAYLVREAVSSVLRAVPEFEVVAVCSDRDDLLDAVERERPDVVVTDIRMPPAFDDEGIQVAARLRTTHPEMGVVILSLYSEPRYALELLEHGSDSRAYLLKDRLREREQLVEAVHAVARGDAVIDPKVVERLVSARAGTGMSRLASLSPREREILAGIASGKGNAAIADSLSVSKRSIEKHIHAIFSKLSLGDSEDVNRRVKAALIFLFNDAEPDPPGSPPGRPASPSPAD